MSEDGFSACCPLHLFWVFIHLNPHSAIPNPQSKPSDIRLLTSVICHLISDLCHLLSVI